MTSVTPLLESIPSYPPDEPIGRVHFSWADGFALLFGCAVTLVIGFYQFGESNHTVYLLSALHHLDPNTLAQDWFTTKTFQYHALFGLLTEAVWRHIEPVFLVGFLLLVGLLHLAWYRIVRLLGGGRMTYMVSVLFLYLSGGATALGVYQFLQDSEFLPSNIASVALLWGICFWMTRNYVAAGAAFALAEVFHLNYAIIGPPLWIALYLWDELDRYKGRIAPGGERAILWRDRSKIAGTLIALVPAGICVLLAKLAMPTRGPVMPFNEFLDLYVHLRHPHHYDPRVWPRALWINFLWPMLPALYACWRIFRTTDPNHPLREAWRWWLRIFCFFMVVLAVAGIFAGWWFVSETLVQMSLFRFSIYPQLFACIATAAWLCDGRPLGRATRGIVAIVIPVVLLAALLHFTTGGHLQTDFGAKTSLFDHLNIRPLQIFVGLAFVPLMVLIIDRFVNHRQGIYGAAILALASLLAWNWGPLNYGILITRDDPAMTRLCEWVQKETPRDAVFLVPPDDERFRLAARRAIVVNYKGVPQLARELPQWRDRLESVLNMEDLRTLPRPMPETLAAIRQRYDELPADKLIDAARQWKARYIVATHYLADPRLRLVYPLASDALHTNYCLYELGAP